MRAKQRIIFLSILFFLLNLRIYLVAAASSTFVSDIVPPAAREAIAKSQRRLTVEIPRVDGRGEVSQGHAFLVNKEQGIILTALHVVDVPADVILQGSRVRFDDVPVVLEYINPIADVAFLKIKQVPEGMEAVTFSKEITYSEEFFAKIEGFLSLGTIHFLMREMVYVGSLRGSAMLAFPTPLGLQLSNIEYLFMQPPPMFSFSGSMVVDKEGKVVGMMSAFLGGYTFVCSGATIELELQKLYKIQEMKEHMKDSPETNPTESAK